MRILKQASILVLAGTTFGQSVIGPKTVDQPVTIPAGNIRLAGSVTIPASPSPKSQVVVFLPAIQLSLGKPMENSGPEELAHQLATRGIASLRYERAANSASAAGPNRLPSPSEIISDAVAALQYGKQARGAGSGSEFLCAAGTSAILAPYIAEKDPQLRGVVLISPSVLPIERILAEQRRTELEQQGKTEAEIRQELASQNDMFADIRAGKTPAHRLIEGAPAAYWLDWMNRNAAEELGKLKVPILILTTDRDDDVSVANNERLQKALGGKGSLAEFHSIKNQKAGSAEGMNLSDPQVVATIAGWLDRHAATINK